MNCANLIAYIRSVHGCSFEVCVPSATSSGCQRQHDHRLARWTRTLGVRCPQLHDGGGEQRLRSCDSGHGNVAAASCLVKPLLRCSRVTKTYRRTSVLKSVDLEVAPGESVAIVGENGSGKSTLLNICAGVLRPDSGSIDRPERIGFCPQQPGLVELLNLNEHVRLAAAGTRDPLASRTRISDLLGELHLSASAAQPVAQLSGGQRQKLNVALMMANNPHLILLDEPYQGFDYGSYLDLWNLITRWTNDGRSVVIITHLLAEQSRVDRVLTLRNGVLQ
jgi:ABC-2 type transport system ATP-binding protein